MFAASFAAFVLSGREQATYFKVLEHDMYPMSWGSATVYISQKTTDPFGDPNDDSGNDGRRGSRTD